MCLGPIQHSAFSLTHFKISDQYDTIWYPNMIHFNEIRQGMIATRSHILLFIVLQWTIWQWLPRVTTIIVSWLQLNKHDSTRCCDFSEVGVGENPACACRENGLRCTRAPRAVAACIGSLPHLKPLSHTVDFVSQILYVELIFLVIYGHM